MRPVDPLELAQTPLGTASPEQVPHPSPQRQRAGWQSLNGKWDFHIDSEGRNNPASVAWHRSILVPFSPETEASGIGETGLHSVLWYRRYFETPALDDSEMLLHFEAVDYRATVWVNGQTVCSHEGGYTRFTAEITSVIEPGGRNEVIVRVEDDPADLAKPRGKQDWKLEPHSIWYPRTSGIWQTVWLEKVGSSYIDRVRWTPHLERWEIGFETFLGGKKRDSASLVLIMSVGDQILV